MSSNDVIFQVIVSDVISQVRSEQITFTKFYLDKLICYSCRHVRENFQCSPKKYSNKGQNSVISMISRSELVDLF